MVEELRIRLAREGGSVRDKKCPKTLWYVVHSFVTSAIMFVVRGISDEKS